MNIDKQLYQEFLRQKQFIEALSPTDEDLHRLFFQDQVIENLTPEEQKTYMRFLLEARPLNVTELLIFKRFTSTPFKTSGVVQWLKTWWHALSLS